ncbi:P68 family surface lipoprotein [Mycoplasma sp. 1654_15]|uniref:P68 family surface lipoprotein n=1 Tax=Mycoplasma sp. 1654_15 TaxID=2725994 RepID=UPI00144931BA|nr:glycerol ABC transporter substrate-binding protein [Mycoplasma sp. 1654_15]QJB71317.1 glycerol ABC transporter substrate-binding protein [Mycoplasma sp. 1654_15]
MNNKNKIIKYLLPISTLFLGTSLFISCTKTQDTPGKPEPVKAEEQKLEQQKVVFATSQAKIWPLMRGITGLIDYYNKNFKDTQNFLEVELKTSEDTKADTEDKTANTLDSDLSATGSKYDLILGNKSSAYVANSYNKLLDVSSSIGTNLFPEKLVENHNKILGSNDITSLKSLPFDLNDTEAIFFNLDVMSVLFDLIKQGGGSIDENSNIYKQVMQAKNKGNSLPEHSFFKALNIKNENVFKDFIVNDDTFSLIDNAFEFAHKVFDGLTVDNSKVFDDTTDATIFSIDYTENVLYKDIISKTGKALWEEKLVKDKNQKDELKVVKNLESDQQVKTSLLDTYQEWNKAFKQIQFTKNNNKWNSHIIESNNPQNQQTNNNQKLNSKTFYSVDLDISGAIRQFNAAFVYMPGVGMNYSVKSPWSKYFASETNKPSSWATRDDVLAISQATKANKDSEFEAYKDGGSSLIVIKSDNDAKNQAVVKFLDFLYKGEITNPLTNKKVSTNQYIIEKTGYFLPTKEVIKQETIDSLKQTRTNYLNEFTKLENDLKNSSLDQTAKKDLESKLDSYDIAINNLQSGIISIESALKFISNDKVKLVPQPAHKDLGKMGNTIINQFKESTKKDKPLVLPKQDFLSKLLEDIKSI